MTSEVKSGLRSISETVLSLTRYAKPRSVIPG
jgi:hypothetical protein